MNQPETIYLITGGKQDYPYWKSLENRYNVTLFVDKKRLQWRKFSIRKKGKIKVRFFKNLCERWKTQVSIRRIISPNLVFANDKFSQVTLKVTFH